MTITPSERYHAAILTLQGEFVGATDGPAFREALDKLRATGKKNVVVDLGAVTFMDSSGLGALIAAATALRAEGGDLKLAAMETSPRLTWMANVFRLHDVFSIHPTADAAAESFAPQAAG
ncbi:MAG TPA: STAS domain-containing protein [Rubricoccaceae bacterium]|nr:STAS domain-containing protein [Rubricoccaceae bacterium]